MFFRPNLYEVYRGSKLTNAMPKLVLELHCCSGLVELHAFSNRGHALSHAVTGHRKSRPLVEGSEQ